MLITFCRNRHGNGAWCGCRRGGSLEEIEKEIGVGLWARMGEGGGREGEARHCKIIYVSKSNVEGSLCVAHSF